jgi:hypothetical protein
MGVRSRVGPHCCGRREFAAAVDSSQTAGFLGGGGSQAEVPRTQATAAARSGSRRVMDKLRA